MVTHERGVIPPCMYNLDYPQRKTDLLIKNVKALLGMLILAPSNGRSLMIDRATGEAPAGSGLLS